MNVVLQKAKVDENGNVSDVTIPNDAMKEQKAFLAIEKIQKYQVIGVGKTYVPILKFRSASLSSTFRLVVSGTIGNFVYSSVFDFVVSHARLPMIKNAVSTRYGRISLKVDYDYHGNGYVSIKRDSGIDTLANMSILAIPYNGIVEHYLESVPTQEYTMELSFTQAGE